MSRCGLLLVLGLICLVGDPLIAADRMTDRIPADADQVLYVKSPAKFGGRLTAVVQQIVPAW